jgi:hypothetical protein
VEASSSTKRIVLSAAVDGSLSGADEDADTNEGSNGGVGVRGGEEVSVTADLRFCAPPSQRTNGNLTRKLAPRSDCSSNN